VPGERLLVDEMRLVAAADATVKIIVTRGPSARGYAPRATSRPTRIVASFPATQYPETCRRDGVRVRRCALVLGEQPRTAGAKTLNRLENVLARDEWDDPAIPEGLLGDAAGRVVEGTMSNVFVAAKGRLATPALSRCGVVGAQRERVCELLAADGTPCVERDIAWEELAEADEVFLTNSLIGVWPVHAMGSRAWPVGPITRRARHLVDEADARA
jgi:4-amino-4-deoxychorismate lyase